MNPRGSINMGAGRSNSQPFLKDSCRVNLVVQLKGPYRLASFDRTTWPRRAPGVDTDHTLEEVGQAQAV
jgi:hypothetical protein